MRSDASIGFARHFATLVLGVAVGAGLVWSFLTELLVSKQLELWIEWIGLTLLLLIPTTALATIFGLWVLRRFWKKAEGSIDKIIGHSSAGLSAAATGNATAAVSAISEGLREAVAWYAPIAARRFIVQTTLALLVAFGSMVGTALLLRQNLLLREQNDKLEQQTGILSQQTRLLENQNEKTDLQIVTAEAQRRSDITSEIFSVLQQVELLASRPDATKKYATFCYANGIRSSSETTNSEKPEYIDHKSWAVCQERLLVLPEGLIGRIRALAAAATPYFSITPYKTTSGGWSFESGGGRALSRQRGQLLIGLAASRVNFGILSADFTNADLKGANLKRANLSEVDLTGADLSFADLSNAQLGKATLLKASLTSSTLLETEFYNINGLYADFKSTRMTDASLEGADLSGATFAGANVQGASFTDSNLSLTDFSGANVELSDFSKSLLFVVNSDSDPLVRAIRSPTNALPNTRYMMICTSLEKAEGLRSVILPQGWSVDKAVAPGHSWRIMTPWGAYDELTFGPVELFKRDNGDN